MEHNQSKKRGILLALYAVLAVACIAYGLMVRALGSGTGFFIVWIGIGIVFAFFAVAVRICLWQKLPSAVKGIFLALVAVFVCIMVVVEGFVISHLNEKGQEGLDYIIVLGAQVSDNGPSPILRYRLDAAIKYLEDNPDTVCIVSGGQGKNEPMPEAYVMGDYLRERGITDARILEEPDSKTTEQNVTNSMRMIRPNSSVGLVTNDFHVFRALQTAKKKGLTNVTGIAAYSPATYLPNNLLREFFGEIKFLLF
ncbi:MAG: YdcF family protein [Agathobacter sp.]|uniref:YdcF family protein n=1 Tax=Agathobacter sp. TaxID=2021311 RepID=UPI0025864918|nr:ElyC/SanA/YdcF family protein [Agathobacter sp.]MCR5677703.1 YdcF family protein [Agathobacter sp.]